MILPRFSVWMFSFGIMFLGAGFVSGQNYPTKPVRIVTSGIGGGNDFVSRLIAQGVSGPLGQQVIVDNRPSGVIPGDIVAKAPPDGYTVLIASGSLWILTLLQDNVPYDPVRDFAPISSIDRDSNVLVVIPSLPAKSVKELIALAKARPGELNYASTATGASGHLSAELFKAMAGVNIVRIPYKGNAQAFTDLIGSQAQVQLMFPSAGSVATHVKSDRLRALAVTAAQPSALFPGLPTVADGGRRGPARL